MSKRKGLSHEEKRTKMMELFYERRDYFQLKELEKLGPKEKGVISQSVKDIVQSLVDDGMVDTDKIGTCVYFWAFPSKAISTRQRKLEELENQVDEVNKRLKRAEDKMAISQVGREGEERTAMLTSISELQEQYNDLDKNVKKYQDCDPEVLDQMKSETKIACEAVNRWTDNIFSVKSWCKNKFFIEEQTLNKQFNIPEELEYI